MKGKTFSYSKIQIYKVCPKRYHFAYILKLPRPGKYYFSYGSTMHKTLELALKKCMAAEEVTIQQGLFDAPLREIQKKTIGEALSLDEFIQIYNNSFIDAFYETLSQRDEFYQRGVESFTNFYNSIKDEYFPGIALERKFDLKLQKNGEVYHLKGIIDRIDSHKDGLEIIDYKSGKKKEFPDNDKMQLYVYALAVNESPEISKGKDLSKLSFFYIDQNVVQSFEVSEKEMEEVKNELISIIDEINKGNFKATPDMSKCRDCDFRNLCSERNME